MTFPLAALSNLGESGHFPLGLHTLSGVQQRLKEEKTMCEERDKAVGRYLKLVRWAEARYRKLHPRGWLILVDFGGKPSIYSRIEKAAFDRHVRTFSKFRPM